MNMKQFQHDHMRFQNKFSLGNRVTECPEKILCASEKFHITSRLNPRSDFWLHPRSEWKTAKTLMTLQLVSRLNRPRLLVRFLNGSAVSVVACGLHFLASDTCYHYPIHFARNDVKGWYVKDFCACGDICLFVWIIFLKLNQVIGRSHKVMPLIRPYSWHNWKNCVPYTMASTMLAEDSDGQNQEDTHDKGDESITHMSCTCRERLVKYLFWNVKIRITVWM